MTTNGGATYTYDQENRIASTAGMTYAYDADGTRVEKSSGPTGTLYWSERPSQNVFPTDRAYSQVLNGVRQSLGRDIDFSNQGDREAIGNALIQHIRQSVGKNVVGENLQKEVQ